MKTRLRKLLEYTPPASKVSWSDIPSEDPTLDVDRLIGGLPPFRVTSAGGVAHHLKTIIVSPLLDMNSIYFEHFIYSDWRPAAQQRIKELIAKGHSVKRYVNGAIVPFNVELFESKYNEIISPPVMRTDMPLTKQAIERAASTALSLPADALLILDKEGLKEIILGDDSDWESLPSFEQVDLSNSLISEESLNHFLRLHGKTIKSLKVDNCFNLRGGTLDESIQLPALEELFTGHISSQISRQLVYASGNLKKVAMRETVFSKDDLPVLYEKLKQATHLRLEGIDILPAIAPFVNEAHLALFSLDLVNLEKELIKKNIDVFCSTNVEEIENLTLCLDERDKTALELLRKLAAAGKKIKVKNLWIDVDDEQHIALFKTVFDTSALESLKVTRMPNKDMCRAFLTDLLVPSLKTLQVSAAMPVVMLMMNKNMNLDALEDLTLEHQTAEANDLAALLFQAKNLQSFALKRVVVLDGCSFSSPYFFSPHSARSRLKKILLDNYDYHQSSSKDFFRYLFREFPALSSVEIYASRLGGEPCLEWLSREAEAHPKIFIFDDIEINREELDALQEQYPAHVILGGTAAEKRVAERRAAEWRAEAGKMVLWGSYPGFSRKAQRDTSDSTTVDANTHPDKKTFHIDRLFIGKPRSPDVRMLRHDVYDTLAFNPNFEGNKNPFILKHASSDLRLKPLEVKQSVASLYETYQASGNDYYFGRIPLTLSNQWQALPSVSADEVLKQYYVDRAVDVEIQRSERDGLFYIRKKDDAPESVTLEMLLFAPPAKIRERELPANIKALIKHYRGFRKVDAGEPPVAVTARDWLNHIREKRAGACRHRAVAFKEHMETSYPDVPVRIVNNKCHSFAEIFYSGQWLSCDLGGYEGRLNLNEGMMPVQAEGEVEPSEDAYQLTYSDRGRPMAPGFFKRAKNLMRLKLNQLSNFPVKEDFSQLDTLEISACRFSAKQLHEFLLRASNVKTLSIVDCILSPAEFAKLDFSGLKQLEYLKLKGSFIPDNTTLATVLKTVPKGVQIEVESESLTEAEEVILPTEAEAIAPGASEALASSVPSIQQQTTSIKITPAKKIPLPVRYFKPIAHKTVTEALPVWCHRLLSMDGRSILVDTPQGEALRQQFQQHGKKINLPCYFINHPDELRCSAHFIKRDGKFGKVCKGPGGPLYDFLMQKYPRALLLVNYDRFLPADIARFNALLDEIAFADGTAVPEKYKILGTLNKGNPEVYQGADLYSRFDAQEKAPEVPSEASEEKPTETTDSKTIELCGGGDWQSRLIGFWTLSGSNALVFQEGALLKAFKAGIKHINFNNAPQHDPDFMRFVHDLSLFSGVYYRGELLGALPQDFQLSFSQQFVFPDKLTLFDLNTARVLSGNTELLNAATLNRFLGTYICDDNAGALNLEKGLIELSAGKTLDVYLGMSLDIYTWLKLIESCREHQVKLNLSFAPGVSLPEELDITPPESNNILLSSHPGTRVIASDAPDAWLDTYTAHEPPYVIDISELELHDLFPSIDSKFKEESGTFHFKNRAGFLPTALAAGKTVILTGIAPPAMVAALQELLYQRSRQSETKGKLILLTSKEQVECYVLPPEVYPARVEKIKPASPVVIPYEERLSALEQVLANHPFLILSGPSGIGKTHFMQHDVKEKHHCHFGEEAMLAWLQDTRAGTKILFIDEANITDSHWSLFGGLARKPPAIFYKGNYYPLSPDHKVVFACNPLSYGGERQMPALFRHPQAKTLTFEPLPAQVLRKELIAPCLADCSQADRIAKHILDVVQFMTACSTDHILITPREIEMMALFARLQVSAHPDVDVTPWIKQYAHTLARPFVPKLKLAEFDARYQPVPPPTRPTVVLPDFVITKSNQAAVTALLDHLAVRKAKQQGVITAQKSGLGGLILEGEPGIGKSVLIKQVMVQQGLKENIDFYVIPVSMSTSEKIRLLLKAFHEGKIVLIDEINSAPMLERVLNALLSGHDLEGNSAQKPGFMLIATQNPISYRGRLETPLPLKHRLQIEKLDNYQRVEMLQIVKHMGLPDRIARMMVDELLQEREKNSDLCFRDLQKCAKQWVRQFGKTELLTTPMNPLPQVGSVCKTVALANIEKHYATMLGYEPLPLEKRKRATASIRQIVKQNGSKQGEILAFEQWQKSLNSMGYESEVVAFKNDISLFIDTIAKQLEQGNLPMIGFAVKRDSGLPDPEPDEPEKTEHAAVITGFNRQTDEITLVHWGKEYVVDATTLLRSNSVLLETRKPEAYIKNPAWSPAQRDNISKYLEASAAVPGARVSAAPPEASGFKGKLLVVKKPERGALLERREGYLKALAQAKRLHQQEVATEIEVNKKPKW